MHVEDVHNCCRDPECAIHRVGECKREEDRRRKAFNLNDGHDDLGGLLPLQQSYRAGDICKMDAGLRRVPVVAHRNQVVDRKASIEVDCAGDRDCPIGIVLKELKVGRHCKSRLRVHLEVDLRASVQEVAILAVEWERNASLKHAAATTGVARNNVHDADAREVDPEDRSDIRDERVFDAVEVVYAYRKPRAHSHHWQSLDLDEVVDAMPAHDDLEQPRSAVVSVCAMHVPEARAGRAGADCGFAVTASFVECAGPKLARALRVDQLLRIPAASIVGRPFTVLDKLSFRRSVFTVEILDISGPDKNLQSLLILIVDLDHRLFVR
mmetsp:Transcript_48250/g.114327  ORF Transcript_48250/g.114327 Transcript_48250/m.114327 type:complete len:324 (-) Transcript_48250:3000-3971(-)